MTLARSVDPARLRPHVAFLKRLAGNPFEAELRRTDVPLVHLDARNLRDLTALRRLLRLLAAESFDLIHAHLTYATIWGLVAARLGRVPCLASLHLPPARGRAWSRARLRDRLMTFLLRRSGAGAIAVSAAVRDAYVRQGRLDAARVAVVHNGVDLAPYADVSDGARAATRRALGLAPEARVVATVSVLRPGKGIDVLLQAAPGVLAADPRTRFLVVGDGPLAASLAAQARQAGLTGGVLWAGRRGDVPALLAASDLFVLPSLDDAFPTALLEAMAAGLPVVATRAGGIPEIVADGRSGLLVPPGDAPALAQAVARLLADEGERAAMGRAGRERVYAQFSARAWITRLEEVYRRVSRACERPA